MKSFKQFILLNEFKKRDFYDFYALQAIQHHPAISKYGTYYGNLSSEKTELDKEIEIKIIEKGNDALLELIDDIALVVYGRYQSDLLHMNLLDINIIQTINPTLKSRWREWEILTQNMAEGWAKIDLPTKLEILKKAKNIILQTSNPRGGEAKTWGQTIDYCINVLNKWPIKNVNEIVLKINEVMQFVHNNGNLLEYLPQEFEKALHTRDVANLAYVVSQTSPEIKHLIKSAGIGYIGVPKEPSILEIFQTALVRAFRQIQSNFGYKNSTINTSLTNENNEKSQKINVSINMPDDEFFADLGESDSYYIHYDDLSYKNKIQHILQSYKKIKKHINLNSNINKIECVISEHPNNPSYTVKSFVIQINLNKFLFIDYLYNNVEKIHFEIEEQYASCTKDLISAGINTIQNLISYYRKKISKIIEYLLNTYEDIE